MNRDEVVKGLEELASRHGNTMPVWNYTQVLRAAIAYMTPPTTEEIEAAREWLHCLVGHKHTALKALDALAREPGLETRLNELEEGVPRLVDANHALHNIETLLMEEKAMDAVRIAALESEQRDYKATCTGYRRELVDAGLLHLADEQTIRNVEKRLARVRETRASLPTFTLFADFIIALDAALAADAGPAVPYVHADCIARGHRCGPGCAVDVLADLPAKPDAGPAALAPTLPPTPWRGPILCDECGGTEFEPRGLCGGVLHPKGSDVGPSGGEPQ